MARDQVPTALTNDDGVPTMLRLNLQRRALGKHVQVHTTFNLRLHDVPVHLVAKIGMRPEQVGDGDGGADFHSRCSPAFSLSLDRIATVYSLELTRSVGKAESRHSTCSRTMTHTMATPRTALENKLQTELHDARRPRGADLAVVPIDRSPIRQCGRP